VGKLKRFRSGVIASASPEVEGCHESRDSGARFSIAGFCSCAEGGKKAFEPAVIFAAFFDGMNGGFSTVVVPRRHGNLLENPDEIVSVKSALDGRVNIDVPIAPVDLIK
jgi:hypothetical protein